ncbi:MAG: hypothetical protein HY674_01670 [Chloroflexi bacterium]|nr:hypothetical protein [Chloroflexota bacterium]
MIRSFVWRKKFRAAPLCVALAMAATAGNLRAQTGPGLSPWERDITAFEAADKTNPPPRGAVLFVGSSSIRLWKTLAADFSDHRVINRGFGGSQLMDAVTFADRIVLPYQPKMIVLYAGDNDIAAKKAPQQVLADFKMFAQKVHQKLPEATIAFIAIKPSLARWALIEQIKEANRLVKGCCQQSQKLLFIDVLTPMLDPDGRPRSDLLAADGLHLNRQGYGLWTTLIKPHLPKSTASHDSGK